MDNGIRKLISNGNFHHLRCETQDELFSYLAEHSFKDGLVEESFHEALVNREHQFPTGIRNQPFNIALPHVDPEHIKTDALVVCSLEEPIYFQRMDKVDEQIPVEMVFLLLIKSKGIHMNAIVGLTEIWSDSQLMNSLLNAKSKRDLLLWLGQNNAHK